MTADELVRDTIDEILEQPLKPCKSAYGLWAKYGPGPSEEEIDENRREMLWGFAEDHP
jgi:hypothetical protein